MMEYNRVQLKQAARHAMKLQRPHPMLITLLFVILVNVGSQIASRILGAASGSGRLSILYYQALLQYEDPASAIQYTLLSFGPQRLALALFVGFFIAGIITSLWSGLMHTGYANFCLGMVRGQQPQTGVLFSVFLQWAGVLLAQFLAGLFRILWGLLFGVCAGLLIGIIALTLSSVVGLALILSLAVYVAVIVGVIWVTLRYALVDFVIADQGLTGMDAIRESRRLMRGNIGRLFTLKLSFIGWYLLEFGVFLVLGIIGLLIFAPEIAATSGTPEVLGALVVSMLGFIGLSLLAIFAINIFNLWLTPYITGTEALFYDWVSGVDNIHPTGGFGGGQGGWGQPHPPQQDTGYTWNPIPGPTSGTGIGPGPQGGGNPHQPPKPPKPPKDDPWE